MLVITRYVVRCCCERNGKRTGLSPRFPVPAAMHAHRDTWHPAEMQGDRGSKDIFCQSYRLLVRHRLFCGDDNVKGRARRARKGVTQGLVGAVVGRSAVP